MKIILDTDFIINAVKNRIDITSELKRILDINFTINILDQTLEELKNKPLEKLVLQIIKSKDINIIKTKKDKTVDDLILIQKPPFIVGTQDRGLKEKLKKAKIPVITIRQKKYFKLNQNVL